MERRAQDLQGADTETDTWRLARAPFGEAPVRGRFTVHGVAEPDGPRKHSPPALQQNKMHGAPPAAVSGSVFAACQRKARCGLPGVSPA
jgi:hypothetical protein